LFNTDISQVLEADDILGIREDIWTISDGWTPVGNMHAITLPQQPEKSRCAFSILNFEFPSAIFIPV
jgi:hypothetical protein